MIAMDTDLRQARTLFFARQKTQSTDRDATHCVTDHSGIDLDEVLYAPLEERERPNGV
jgi:inorganic pyrophosphatase/exopolyphosphatase